MKQFYLIKKINSIVSTVLVLLGLKEESVGTTSVSKKPSFVMFLLLLCMTIGQSVSATTCPNATVIAPGSLPITSGSIVCGTTNNIPYSALAASAQAGGCTNSNYYGGLEALYSFTPTTTGLYDIGIAGQTWTQIAVFNGCPTTTGTTCVGGVASSTSSKNLQVTLTSGVTYFILFNTFPAPPSPCPGTFSLSLLAPNTATASAAGGLWSNPATWGGTLPNAASTVVIPTGSIVTVDQVVSVAGITVNGRLQWNASSNAMTLTNNLVINSGGSFLPYTTGGTGQTVNIAGNFQNDGYANLAVTSTLLNFNGSGSTLSGSGTFQGDGTKGIIRTLAFQNTGSNSITTSQNLIVTSGLLHTAGSLNTNGKLTVDNTSQVYGQAFNTSVASVAVTAMGSLYNVAPVVFGAAVTQWTNIAGTVNTLYVSGTNVYRATGNISGTAPTHTSGITQNLLWVGTVGTIGTPFQFNASVSVGTQVFYGNNLYVCTVAGIPSSAAPPVHTSGTASSGAATFLYVGTPATVSVNYDSVTQTVRSLNLISAGSGYSSTPSIGFGVGVAGGTGSGAAATAVFFQQIAGPASVLFQKSGGAATISGGLTINSDAGAGVLAPTNEQASSGVGAISTSNGGVNYTVAPAVGFAGPTALNLIQNPGSGYDAAPTITVSGGTIVSGTAYTSASFTIAVNAGTIQAVYLTSTAAVYSVPPTLTMSAPTSGTTATLAFPTKCWPEATAVLGTNGQVVSFTVDNSGFGYVTAPAAIVGTTGTFTTAATAPTTRLALYNLTTNNFIPSPTAVAQGEDAAIPANRKINTLSLGGASAGMNVTSNLVLFGSSPLSLTTSANAPGSVINLGGNNLLCTWNGYGGATGTFGTSSAYIKNGSMTLIGRGGSSSFNFPFSGTFNWFAGNGTTAANGSSVTRVTVSDTAAPTNATQGTSFPAGGRAFRVQYANIGTPAFGVLPVTGTNPTVSMGFNNDDALTALTQDVLLISDSASLTGPWSFKSVASGSGAITSATTGSRTTTTTAPGPIVPSGDNYYAWSVSAPTITDFSPLTLCSNSGTFTITGTNLTGITNLQVGGTAVTSFTVVSATQITGVVGNGTDGFVSLQKNGNTITGSQSITVTPSPIAPTVTPASASIVLGGAPNVTASGSGGTFNWFTTPTGGSPVFTGPTYALPVCATTTLYVAENNGSCDGPRTAVPVTVQATVIAASIPTFCGTGGTTTLSVTPVDATISYTWTSISGASITNTTGNFTDATIVSSSDFQVTGTSSLGGCTAIATTSVSVYPLPTATVTTSASGVCAGTSATINSGLSAGNFTSTSIAYAPKTAPGTATTLVSANVFNVPLTGGTGDDGGWGNIPLGFNFNFFGTSYSTINVGTNGTLQFGAFNNNGGSTLPYGLSDFAFSTLPSTSEPFNVVAVLAMDNDLRSADGGAVKYWTEGIAPNRKFIVSYEAIKEFGDTKYSTSQAIFYETTGVIEVQVTSSTNVDRNKLVGINNGNGTLGALAYSSGTSATTTPQNPITSPFAYRFSPPSNYTVTWTAFDTVTNVTTTPVNAVTNAFTLVVTPANTTTYTISYTDQTTGCTNLLNSAQVTMTILDNVAPATTAVSNVASVCLNGSANLSLTGNVNSIGNTDGLSYQWQVDTGSGYTNYTGTGSTTAAITVTPTTTSTYQCLVTACGGTAVASSPVSLGFTNLVDSTTPGTRCGTGTVTLGATTSSSGATLSWYTASSGGTAIGSGASFTTPTITTTTTYYVAAETTGPACSSPRVAVTATVTAAPAFALNAASASICTGTTSATFTDAASGADYNTFTITPTTGVATSNLSGVFSASFNPTVTTTYTITASQSGGSLCTTFITFTVTVNSTSVTAIASPDTICAGGSSTITAVAVSPASGTVAIGTGTDLTSATSQPTAFCNRWPSYRMQTVYTAAELQAAGLSAGNITSMAFDITTLGDGATNSGMVIQIGATSLSTLSTFESTAGYTTVYPSQTYTHTASGLQTIPFSTPYTWDGTSNIIIDMVQNGANLTNNSITLYTATAGNTVAYTTTNASNTASLSTNRLNVVFAGQKNTPIPGATFAWNDSGSTTGNVLTISPSATTTYTVTANNPSTGCTATGTATVTVLSGGAVITTPPTTQTRCLAGTATFSVVATGINLTYQWQKGSTTLTNGGSISGATTDTLTITGLVAGDAGDYNVVITSDCGAPVSSANATLTVVTPLASINAPITTVCSGTPVTLTENGGSATSWSWAPGGATTSAITVTPLVTTNYVVTATTQVSGCTATANVTINVNETPSAITVVPASSTICSGSTVGVNVSGGSYTTTRFSDSFDAVSSQFTAATVSGTTTTTAALNTTYQTEGSGSVLFNTTAASSVATYSLNSNVNLAGATTATISFSHIASMEGPGTSFDFGYVEYSSDGGTTWTTFTSSNYAGTASTGVFTGSDVRFSTRSYPDWISTFANATAEPTNALWKNETFTVPAGALTNQFKIRFRYTTDISGNYLGWYIDNVKVLAAGGGSSPYAWTATPTTTLYTDNTLSTVYNPLTDFAATVYAQPTAETQFTATVANGVCSNSGSATVSVNPLPVITLADNITVCKGTGATITIPEINNTYSWSPSTGLDNNNTGTVLANPETTTTYTVTTTNTSNFCQSTDQITVNVNDPGMIVTQPTNKATATGFGTSYTVAGTVGITYSYQWQIKTGPTTYADLANNANYAGVATSVLTVSNAGSGTALNNTIYRCLLTPPAPCADLASNDALLTVSNTGIATSPADVNICLPTPSTATFSVVTNGDDAYLVEWQVSTDNGINYTTISLIDVEDTFLYTGPNTTAVPGLTFEHPIDALNPNGTGSEFKVLNVSGITNPATLKFRAIVNEVLPSGVATLNVSSPVGFTQNLATAEVIRCTTPAPASATNLNVTTSGTVTSVQWRYDTTPGGSFTNVVANNTPVGATYTASSVGSDYSLAVTTNASTPAGSYYYKAFVLGTAACGTTPAQSDTATITVANPAVAIISSSASYCSPGGAAVTLTASGAATYSWTSTPAGFTSSSNSISVTPSVVTSYTVVGTDANGCTNTATSNVGVGTSFTVAASAATTTVCPNTSVALTAVPTSAGPTTYLINTIPYQFTPVAGTFTALSGTTVSSGLGATDDDAMSPNITPGSGFSFNYGGTSYATFRVSSNGQLVFGNAGVQVAANNLASTTATHRPGLAPLWDDLQVTQGVNYQMSGTAPNRVLTVEWLNMEWNYQSTTPVISFQVKLYETTNVVEYVYNQESTAYNPGTTGGASIGLIGTASGNYLSLQDTGASPVLSTSTSKNDITVKPATGQIYRFTPVTPSTYTYAWTPAVTGTGASVTASPAVTTAYNVTATNQSGCTATAAVTVNVDSTPPTYTTTTAASQSLCSGSAVSFAVSATSTTPLTYQWKKNGVNIPSATSATLSGTATSAVSTASNFTSGTYTVDIIGCTTVTATFNLLVNPLPTATVAGTASVCLNDAQPLVTFTGAAGTAPYTFTYKLNGGSNQTLITTSGDSATLSVPTTTGGAFTYSLVSVQDSSSSTCSQTQTGTATITVNSLPIAATLSTNSPVCSGNTLNLTATVAATSPAIISQNFESGLGAWTVTAASTGGTNTALANFIVKTHGSSSSSSTAINSPGGSSYILADPNGAGSGVVLDTKLTSPSFSTVGYAAVSLSFRHYHRYVTTAPSVQVSTDNGATWTSVASYASNQGTVTSFVTATVSLNAYKGLPNVKVRYNYTGGWIWYWAIDDISITGTPETFTYAWSGPNSFSSTVQNPSIANATVADSGTYALEITNSNGCKATSTVVATVGTQPTWFLDADGDHYYTGTGITQCDSPGAGYTTTGLLGGNDCNDGANTIYPNAPEICYNGILENCNGTLSQGCAPVVVNMTPSYNNTTLPSLAIAVPAVPYSYAPYTNIKYRFSITNVTTGVTAPDIIQTSRFVTIPVSIHSYNSSYTITAGAVINEEILPFAGNTITVLSPVVQLITLSSASCGSTLATLTTQISANPGLNATSYTFRIRLNDANPTPVYGYSPSATRFVGANSFVGFPLQYSSSYKVAVQYTFNDPVTGLPVESGYGAECTLNTPSIPLRGLASPVCGSQVTTLTAGITSAVAPYATAYRFRIRLASDNGPTPQYYYTAPNASRFSSLGSFQGITYAYSTVYSIAVEYSIVEGMTTVWSGFGPECQITTPFFPVTSLVASQCGQPTATSLTQTLNITPYPGFPMYMVKLEEVEGETVTNTQELEFSYSYFRLNQFSIAQNDKSYSVSVKIKLNGVYGDYDTACDLFTAPIPTPRTIKPEFKASAYPNPFANNFMIDVKTSSESVVALKVYDMVGRLIEQREVRVLDLETTTIGDRYPSGVYNVVVSQEDSVQTVRVVKR